MVIVRAAGKDYIRDDDNYADNIDATEEILILRVKVPNALKNSKNRKATLPVENLKLLQRRFYLNLE